MTITTTFTNGTNADADEVNRNFKDTEWSSAIYSHQGAGIAITVRDTLVHSPTIWTRLDDTSTMRTTDGGANWVAVSADVANMKFGVVSVADGSKAISWSNGTNIAITSNSGDNWVQASTDPADDVYSASFITATVAVVGTNKSVGARGIYFSTDGGDNWTICSTGPTVAVAEISMFNATTGFAIADGGAIWKTVNGGIDWTNTTHSIGFDDIVSGNIVFNMLALSTTELIGLESRSPIIVYYDSSGNATRTQLWDFGSADGGNAPFNPIKLTNGNIILGFYGENPQGAISQKLFRLTSPSDTNCEILSLSSPDINLRKTPGASLIASTLSEYDTNKIMVVGKMDYTLLDEN